MVKKIFLVLACALIVLAMGCSGKSGLTPDIRDTTIDPSFAGTFYVTDLDGKKVLEGTLLRAEDGTLTFANVRNLDGTLEIDVSDWGVVNVTVDYLEAKGYTKDGYAIYYIGSFMK